MQSFGLRLPEGTGGVFFVINEVLIWISTFFAVLSGVIYLVQNRDCISDI